PFELGDSSGLRHRRVCVRFVDSMPGKRRFSVDAVARRRPAVRSTALDRVYTSVYTQFMAATRVQVVRWGNSKAVRLPKAILEQARLREGDELSVRVQHHRIILEPSKPAITIENLIVRITPKNLHRETEWGASAGIETW
ncbi:MAG: hypothetical protein DMG91_03985, partial [Acidobacteria bacterium]